MPSAEPGSEGGAVVCLDVGSTFTKALLVGLSGAEEGQEDRERYERGHAPSSTGSSSC